jgi:hypothetical protein
MKNLTAEQYEEKFNELVKLIKKWQKKYKINKK